MGQFDYLTLQVINRKNDYTIYTCPYCGTENMMNSIECKMCKNSLVEFENLFYSRFNLYNESLDLIKANKLLSAYERIITFLNFYPQDLDAQHLRFYIMYSLKANDFLERAENYLQLHSDRWLAIIIDTPEKIALSDFPYKTEFLGTPLFQSIDKFANAKQEERNKNAMQLIEIINRIYDIYRKIKNQKKKNLYIEEFKFFYEKIFLKYLMNYEINVIDYLGRNFNELNEQERKFIGCVDAIENNRIKNGCIVEVFMPEIRYHSIIIQRAKITVNINNKITKQEK